jgi:hypothetical protein
MSSDSENRPQHAKNELIPIWQTDFLARWMVSVGSTVDENDPHTGWADIDADARTGMVTFGDEYTPAEARLIAQALFAAADHAENFGNRAQSLMFDLTCAGNLPELAELPVETQRAVRHALMAAGHRYRKQQHQASAEVQG